MCRLICVCLCIAAGLTFGGCSNGILLPVELAGTWVTEDPRYSGRYMALSPADVRFGTSDDSSQRFSIREVRRESEQGRILYTVDYESTSGGGRLHFFHQVDRDRIVFKNQPNVNWLKQRDRS